MRASAAALRPDLGAEEPTLGRGTDTGLVAALSRAAGIPVVVNAVERDYRTQAIGRTGWPFTRWVRVLRPDPLKRLRLGARDATEEKLAVTAGDVRGVLGRSSLPPPTPAARAAVDLATRSLGDRAAAGLPPVALAELDLQGLDPIVPSSFAVGSAAQASMAAAALAASELAHARGQARQRVAVDMVHAAIECTGWFSLDGRVPELWDAFSGLYRCADGHVRIHANFAHHREGALRLLGLDPAHASRADAERELMRWRALDFERGSRCATIRLLFSRDEPHRHERESD